jgi:hypothetical protein
MNLNLVNVRLLTRTLTVLVTALAATAFGADTAYNGGQATNPKDLKGKKVVLADVPKLIGIGYFNATSKGIAEGCADLTKNGLPTEVTTDAPTVGDIQKHAMRAVIDGKLKPGDTELDAGKLGKLKIINGSQILLGPPHVFTKDDIDKYDF